MAIIKKRRGSALLAVLWLSLALSAIAFSLATTVRGETERTSTAVDGIRSYYLATGAIERAILYMQWGKEFYSAGTPVLRMSFPTGEAEVEVIPETAKYNINRSKPEDLLNLMASLGTRADQAQEVVNAIVDWRSPGDISALDQYYLSLVPSFRARHASFEEIEELLVLKGMTTDLYYGTYDRDAGGRLFRRGGLNECVSVYGATDRFDANTAQAAIPERWRIERLHAGGNRALASGRQLDIHFAGDGAAAAAERQAVGSAAERRRDGQDDARGLRCAVPHHALVRQRVERLVYPAWKSARC
jgi:hypothetical protein